MRHPEKLVRLPGVAPGHSPWRGDILLLNHSRMESKRAGSVLFHTPGRAISTKNKHLLLSGFRYQPTVSRWFFRCFGAHLLRSPKIAKSGLNHLARIYSDRLASGPAENLGSPAPLYVFCLVTSFRCRFVFVSQSWPFVSGLLHSCMDNKKPCFHLGKQGWKSLDPLITLPAYQKPIGVIPSLMFTQTT